MNLFQTNRLKKYVWIFRNFKGSPGCGWPWLLTFRVLRPNDCKNWNMGQQRQVVPQKQVQSFRQVGFSSNFPEGRPCRTVQTDMPITVALSSSGHCYLFWFPGESEREIMSFVRHEFLSFLSIPALLLKVLHYHFFPLSFLFILHTLPLG